MTRAKDGQSLVEAALVLLAVATALAVFFSFIKASVSSRLKLGADSFGQGLVYECDGQWAWQPCSR